MPNCRAWWPNSRRKALSSASHRPEAVRATRSPYCVGQRTRGRSQMDSEDKLQRSKRAARARAAGTAPGMEALVPEVRTAVKWKPVPIARPFRIEAQIVIVWRYGVPLEQVDGLHDWLATNEVDLFNLCKAETGAKVNYLGTFLHVESGTPMYETRWGYAISQKVPQEECERALQDALTDPNRSPLLRQLITQLRSYWVRDPGSSDHAYGLAANYRNIKTLPRSGPFWDVTVEAIKIPPV